MPRNAFVKRFGANFYMSTGIRRVFFCIQICLQHKKDTAEAVSFLSVYAWITERQ